MFVRFTARVPQSIDADVLAMGLSNRLDLDADWVTALRAFADGHGVRLYGLDGRFWDVQENFDEVRRQLDAARGGS